MLSMPWVVSEFAPVKKPTAQTPCRGYLFRKTSKQHSTASTIFPSGNPRG